MKTITTIDELKKWVREKKHANASIGIVPTMGALHDGHLSLLKKARKENDAVVMSLFVNPAQFGPDEDFDRYPRDFDRDHDLAEAAGADVLFAPSTEEMYPTQSRIAIHAGEQAQVMCGVSRPGHFDGVLKVVTKLFHLTEADRAYFGQKDAQQLAIIEAYVRDYDFPLTIVRGETVREEDGLAKSSRNVYLTETERTEAPHLQKALQLGTALYLDGKDPIPEMTDYIQKYISGKIDYIELHSFPDLHGPITNEAVLAIAVQFGGARLIDNTIFKTKGTN